jgi:hypothetical protein
MTDTNSQQTAGILLVANNQPHCSAMFLTFRRATTLLGLTTSDDSITAAMTSGCAAG